MADSFAYKICSHLVRTVNDFLHKSSNSECFFVCVSCVAAVLVSLLVRLFLSHTAFMNSEMFSRRCWRQRLSEGNRLEIKTYAHTDKRGKNTMHIGTFLGEEVPHVKYLNSIFLLKVIYHALKMTRYYLIRIVFFLFIERKIEKKPVKEKGDNGKWQLA